MEAMALWLPKVGVSKASGGPLVDASTGPAQGYGLGIPSLETSCGGTGAPPSLGISACRLLPWPHFLPPGTTVRRTRLGGTETGWRLNRKWEWGFQKGRQ